jgi:hypothetical protein
MKEGSLFCTYEIYWTRMLQIRVLSIFRKPLMRRGLGSMTFGLVVQKFLNIETISSLRIKLYRS